MAEVRDTSSIIDAAAEAAGAGDFPSAAEHLQRAVALEEASFGPMHAELANVLNNLGVVYERLDRPDKAEACYRRAYAIAKAAFPPGDSAILLSENNLREFCVARDIPFEPPSAASAPLAASPQRVSDALVEDVQVRATRPEPTPSASSADSARPQSTLPRTTIVIAGLVVAVAIVGLVIATRSSTTDQPANRQPTAATAPTAPERAPSEAVTPAPPANAAAASPTQSSPSPTTTPAPPIAPPVTHATPRATEAGKAARTETRRPPKASAAPPTVVSAQLCRELKTSGNWRCTPVSDAVTPGPMYFYTRLKASSDTTVEHRWYRGNRLQQKMTLRIRANQGTGYRTYSRATLGAAGEWRVDLQTMDGNVLHEERFTVAQ